jgi:hypothetical protein
MKAVKTLRMTKTKRESETKTSWAVEEQLLTRDNCDEDKAGNGQQLLRTNLQACRFFELLLTCDLRTYQSYTLSWKCV